MVDFKRKPWNSIGLLLLGLLFVIDVARDSNFNLVYDGIKVILALTQIGFSIWGFLTPIASIEGRQLIINESAFSSRIFSLKSTPLALESDYLHLGDTTETYKFSLSQIRESERQEFIRQITPYTVKMA